MPTVSDIVAGLEQFAPLSLAADWDNVGLLLGDSSAPVQRILTCLTLTPVVAAEAIEDRRQLIVTHHPVFFHAIKRLTTADTEGRMMWDLARAGIAVYSPHTAFDNTVGGINDQLAAHLGLTDVRPLRPAGERNCKIVVFVPETDLGAVSDALFAAGAGQIGDYRECSFRCPGAGTFFGGESTQPAVGQKGRREEVQEWRLEVVCPERAVPTAIRALRQAHSYEEPAFDVYPLRPSSGNNGEGRIGRLTQPQPLGDIASRIGEAISSNAVAAVGDPSRPVQSIAIVCGSGGEFLADAIRAGADAFLTGEMRFHGFVEAQSADITAIIAGHYATERFAMEALARQLQQRWPDCSVAASRRETDPLTWIR